MQFPTNLGTWLRFCFGGGFIGLLGEVGEGRGDLLYLVAITYYEAINHWNELPCKFLIIWKYFFSCNPSCFMSNDSVYNLSFKNQTPFGLRFSFFSFVPFIFLKLNSTMFSIFMINKIDLFHSCTCLSILGSKRFHLNMLLFVKIAFQQFLCPTLPKCFSNLNVCLDVFCVVKKS